jgi:hypothetical protein
VRGDRGRVVQLTEPILHPGLPELIRIVESNGIPCHLSSNLNQMRNIDAVLAENPYAFRISASGFTQDVYGYTHRGGNIDRVKQHMIELADAKRRQRSTTLIHVLYHRYKHNLPDEKPMREFAHSLGIGFEGVWAFMMPLEKVLAYVNDDPAEATLTEEDHQLIGNLALPLKEAIAAAETQRDAPCSLRDAQMTLDFEGNVQLCCGTYDTRRFTLGQVSRALARGAPGQEVCPRHVWSLHAPRRARVRDVRRSRVRCYRRPYDRPSRRPPHRIERQPATKADPAWRRVAVSEHGGAVPLPQPVGAPGTGLRAVGTNARQGCHDLQAVTRLEA